MQVIHTDDGRTIIKTGGETIVFEAGRIGNTISRLRKEADMTQMELAEAMGVSFQAVSNWERGQSMPDIARLTELAGVLNSTVDELLDSRTAARLVERIQGEDRLAEVPIAAVEEIAPMLKPSQLAKVVDAHEELDIHAVVRLAPHLGAKTLLKVAEKLLANGSGVRGIAPLAPFLDPADVDRFAADEYERNGSLHGIAALAPFMSEDALLRYARDHLAERKDLSSIAPIAPFLPDDYLNGLARDALAKHGLNALSPIMPFIDASIVEEYIESRL